MKYPSLTKHNFILLITATPIRLKKNRVKIKNNFICYVLYIINIVGPTTAVYSCFKRNKKHIYVSLEL